MNCDDTRELLPEFAARRAPAIDIDAIVAHLETCADCRAALEVVALVRAPVQLPAAAIGRVQAAAAREAAPRPVRLPRMVMAAAIAIVAAGSGLLLARAARPDPADAAEVGWAARNDPLLHGGTALPELSVGELELLLEELES